MKRLSLFSLLALSMGLLTGCPIFDDSGPGIVNCRGDDCGDPGGGGTTTSTTNTNACKAPSDCTGINETCGSDGECHTGDCTLLGCVSGFFCRVGDDMKAHCVDSAGTGGAGGASTGGTGGTGGAPGTGGASTGGAPGTGGAGGASTGGTGGASTGGTGGAGGASTGGTGGASTGGAPGTGGTGGN